MASLSTPVETLHDLLVMLPLLDGLVRHLTDSL